MDKLPLSSPRVVERDGALGSPAALHALELRLLRLQHRLYPLLPRALRYNLGDDPLFLRARPRRRRRKSRSSSNHIHVHTASRRKERNSHRHHEHVFTNGNHLAPLRRGEWWWSGGWMDGPAVLDYGPPRVCFLYRYTMSNEWGIDGWSGGVTRLWDPSRPRVARVRSRRRLR